MEIEDECQECKKIGKCGACPVMLNWVKEHREENEERKEAIKELKYLFYTMPIKPPMECDDKWKDNNKKLRTALEYAITSLQEKVPIEDAVSRQAVIDALYDWELSYTWDEHCKEEYDSPYIISPSKVIDGLPPTQAEIITCIDCIHYTPLGKDKAWGRCSVHSRPTENQRMCQSCDFCSWAERRTDE